MTPRTSQDIADSITWKVTRPWHVSIDAITILATDQADATTVHRRN